LFELSHEHKKSIEVETDVLHVNNVSNKVFEDMEEQGGTLLDIRNKFEHDIGHFDKVTSTN
jgi:predicted sulfurtransferase